MAIENVLEAYGNNLVGAHIDNSSGSSGHTIKDGDGTAMTPQPNLQFADANVSNDGTNNATVVRNFVDIDWDDWQKVDDSDDTYYRVTDAPLVDGNVEIDLMKKLWENPAPTASFVAQNITLNSADYDFLRVEYSYAYNPIQIKSVEAPKGKDIYLDGADATGNGARGVYRIMSYVSDTSYSVSQSRVATGVSASSYVDSYLIPVAIYGIKQKFTISLSAIISNVSTSASKCIMPDGETSVADALEYEQLSVTIASGVTNAAVRCERLGKLVMLNFRGTITPSSNLIILSGLPVPKGTIPFATNVGSGAPSLFQIETDGVLKLISSGSTGSGYFGVTLSYVAN